MQVLGLKSTTELHGIIDQAFNPLLHY